MKKKFDTEAVRREIDRCFTSTDGEFDLAAIWAATKVQGSSLFGLADDPEEIETLLERAYGEDKIGYRWADKAKSRMWVGLVRTKH